MRDKRIEGIDFIDIRFNGVGTISTSPVVPKTVVPSGSTTVRELVVKYSKVSAITLKGSILSDIVIIGQDF